ncbi:MAG: hypothetical protein H6937_09470 [Burkholderiales bacterium]|nr:hypothetical protein [Burkholderiales bacterium]
MALLKLNPTQTAPVYNDPRAAILSGSGNSNISNQTLKQYFSRPNIDPKQALADVLKHNVSFGQISKAGISGLEDQGKLRSYAESQGISFDQTKPEPITYEIPEVRAKLASFVKAEQDPVKGTVAGQLDQILSNPNSPLLKRANYLGTLDANRRGLGNSSIATEAGLASMTDAGRQIATPDAAANNTFALTNADAQNRLDMFNVDQGNKVVMFNSGTAADILKNRENLGASILNNRESLANNLAIANLDTNTKLAVADLQARSEDSKFAASLYDTLLKIQESINSNPDMTPDDKARYFSDAVKTMTSGIGLLDTFASADLGDLNFSSTSNNTGSASSNTQTQKSNNTTNIKGNTVEKTKIDQLEKLNSATGMNYDPSQVLSESEMNAIKNDPNYINNPGLIMKQHGVQPYTYPTKDGMTQYNGIWVYV